MARGTTPPKRNGARALPTTATEISGDVSNCSV
jgi:hypothetical protein